jgi:hypothetical protein
VVILVVTMVIILASFVHKSPTRFESCEVQPGGPAECVMATPWSSDCDWTIHTYDPANPERPVATQGCITDSL